MIYWFELFLYWCEFNKSTKGFCAGWCHTITFWHFQLFYKKKHTSSVLLKAIMILEGCQDDDMMIWYDDMMIWWYDDIIIFSRFRILYRYLFIIIWTSVPGNNCGSPPAFPNCYSFEKGIIGKILLFDWEIRSNHNFVDLHCTSERAILLLLRYFCALAATDIATILFSKFNNSVSKMLLPNHCYIFRTQKEISNFKDNSW